MKTRKISLIVLAVVLIVMVALVAVACDKKPTEATYTVTLNSGTGAATTLSAKAGETASLPSPTIDGATFVGWYTKADGQGEQWTNETAVNDNVVLYAAWQLAESATKYTIKFDFMGAIEDDGTVMDPLEKQTIAGLAVYFPAVSRTGYDFLGWFTKKSTGDQVADGSSFDKDTTLYARWQAQTSHTHDYSIKITVAPTCTAKGYDYYVCACGDVNKTRSNFVNATGHEFDFSNVKYNGEDDYFEMVYCSHEGCDLAKRRDSNRPFDNVFKYTYNTNEGVLKSAMDARIETLYDVLDPESANYVGAYNQAEHAWAKPSALYDENKTFEHTYYDPFIEDLNYVVEQYQVCYVYYCVYDQNAEWKEKFDVIQEAYNDMIATYYALFRKVYNTKYRNFFFSEEDGWTPEDIEKALTLSDAYGDGEYKEIKDQIDDIEVAFRELSDNAKEDGNTVPSMYKEYVALNNRLAQLSGYDNYVEYAYENVYDRDFSPEDIVEIRAYVKQYIVPIFNAIYSKYYNAKRFDKNSLQEQIKSAILDESIFKSKIASDLVGSYLKKMNITDEDGNVVQSYYNNVNELFRVGNYFPGAYSGAFNYWISAQEKSALYFGPGSYSGPFTFVHEFGHYNNSYYNEGTSMPFDIDETHSQGNEMMFLAYLSKNLPDNCDDVYEVIKNDQLFNMLAISLLAMAVDEFEQTVYTRENMTVSEYDSLFNSIMREYQLTGVLNAKYWRYVVIESACYYISYSTSALASLQLYALAMEEIEETGDFAETREKYYKLITFTDDDENAHTDFVGDRVIDIGFGDILEYAGLHNVFKEDYYTFIYDYFM